MSQIIAIISNTALHVQRSRTNLITALQSIGASVVLVSPYDGSVPTLQRMGVVHEHVDMSQYGTNPFKQAATYFAIRAILRRHDPSVCLCYTIKANTIGSLAGQSLGIPVINNIAGTGRAFDNSGWLFRRLVMILFAISLRRSARVFFQNIDDKQFFIQHRMVQKDLARGIPGSGVDLNRFELSTEFPTGPVFLFIGRLLLSKGVKMYVDAAMAMIRQGTNAKFLMAGERVDEGAYLSAQDLETFAAQERCTYLGQVPPDRITDLLGTCTFLVLPSFYGEGVPKTLLEAGAMGRPIISTDSVGCKDVVRHGINGIKIPPRDQGALLAAMCEAARLNKETLLKLGRQGRAIVEREFDERFVIQAYLDECQRLLAGSAQKMYCPKQSGAFE